jgi:hypothetical protein
MRNQIRTFLSAWKVQPYTQLQAADHRNFAYDRLAAVICQEAEYRVLGGPYAGMQYFGPPGVPIIDQCPITRILGSYEEEIHPWLDAMMERSYESFVHIGGGSGYHAVGLAMRLPESRAIVFDTLIASRKAIRQLADMNDVRGRLQLRGFCDADGLLDVDLRSSMLIIDCGGAEFSLLDVKVFPDLRVAPMLVELHDYFDDRITPRLMSRFSATHRIEIVSQSRRDPARYPFLEKYSQDEREMAVDEKRKLTRTGKPQTWALLTPYAS